MSASNYPLGSENDPSAPWNKVEPKMRECTECDGEGYFFYSYCCGAAIEDGECTDCGDLCISVKEKCGFCNGEGEVSV